MTIRNYYTSAIILTFLISCSSPKIRSTTAIQFQDTIFSTTTRELKSSSIPDYVFSMKSLKHIQITGMDCDYGDLKNCWGIEEIPKRIRDLKKLTSLILNVNGIQSIPIELAELKELKILDLSDNAALTSVDNVEKILSLNTYLFMVVV